MSLMHKISSRRSAGSNDPGLLDRVVSLMTSAKAQLSTGEVVLTWVTYAQPWAKKLPVSSARVQVAEGKHALSLMRFRIRHRTDVAALHRLVHGDDIYEITGVDELGRRHLLDLECRAVDQTTGAGGGGGASAMRQVFMVNLNAGEAFKAVTFPMPFSTVPAVMPTVTLVITAGADMFVVAGRAGSLTTTGFTVDFGAAVPGAGYQLVIDVTQ